MRFYWDLGKVVINILSDITAVERKRREVESQMK